MAERVGCARSLRPLHQAVQGFAHSASPAPGGVAEPHSVSRKGSHPSASYLNLNLKLIFQSMAERVGFEPTWKFPTPRTLKHLFATPSVRYRLDTETSPF